MLKYCVLKLSYVKCLPCEMLRIFHRGKDTAPVTPLSLIIVPLMRYTVGLIKYQAGWPLDLFLNGKLDNSLSIFWKDKSMLSQLIQSFVICMAKEKSGSVEQCFISNILVFQLTLQITGANGAQRICQSECMWLLCCSLLTALYLY